MVGAGYLQTTATGMSDGAPSEIRLRLKKLNFNCFTKKQICTYNKTADKKDINRQICKTQVLKLLLGLIT